MKPLARICFQLGCKLTQRGATNRSTSQLGRVNLTTLTSASNNASYLHAAEPKPLLGATIGQMIDLAPDRFGDQWAVIDCDRGIRKNHSELNAEINKLAAGLLALNLQRGDRIAIWCPNRYEWILTQLAAAKMGLILVTLNPAYQANEFAYCLGKVGIRAVVIPESFKTQNYYEMICKVVPQVIDSKSGQIKSKMYPNFDTMITLSDQDLPGTFKFTEIMNSGGSREKERLEKLQGEIQFDDPVYILFTSGTTGKPKAATLTHLAVNNNGVAINQRMRFFDKPNRICSLVPLFHCFGCVCVVNTSIVSGSCTVFPSPGFSAEEALKSIEKEKCTCIFGTPTMYIDMLNHPNINKTNFSSLKSGIVGGSPCPPEVIRQVIDKMDCQGLVVGYGTTETSPVISIHDRLKDDQNTKLTTTGRLIEHIEVKIVDSNDKIVPLEIPGEICVRGYNVMKGYWEDEEKTKEVMKDGWYHTGDIGFLTSEGQLTVSGRIKDMIIRGGENVYPKEIEDYLITHPKIGDVYIIGVADKRMGEEICAWIKLKANETINEAEVKEFCKGQISHFKIPKYIRFVDDFPKTTSGKVQKFIMKEEMIEILKNLGLL